MNYKERGGGEEGSWWWWWCTSQINTKLREVILLELHPARTKESRIMLSISYTQSEEKMYSADLADLGSVILDLIEFVKNDLLLPVS